MPKNIIITFDDGFPSHYTHVIELLKKYNYRAIFALITKDIDVFWTDDKIQTVLDTKSVICSHTETHKDMINEYDEMEVTVSFEKLKKKNISLTGFIVPYYKYNKKVQELLSQYGIKYSMNYGARNYKNEKIYYTIDEFKKNALDLVRFNVPYSTKEKQGESINQITNIINTMEDNSIVTMNIHNVLKKLEVSPYDVRYYLDYDELESIFMLFKENNINVALPEDFLA